MFAEVLTGIALVKKSVDFIKENIQTAKDIGELAGSIDDLLDGKQQLDKKRSKKDGLSIADQFGVKTVAASVIDQKLAAEELYNISQLIDHRFGHGTWAQILAERKKRIDEFKAATKKAAEEKKKANEQLMETFGIILAIVVLGAILLSVAAVFLKAETQLVK